MTRSRLTTSLAALALLGASLAIGAGAGTSPSASGATPVSATSVRPVSPLGHVGRWLTDADGRVVLLNGINYVSKAPSVTPEAAGFSDDDAAWLADNGFDVVRLGTGPNSIMPTPGVVDTAYVASFAATVHTLTSHGLLVLVDLHQDGWGPTTNGNGFPDWMTVTHGATNTMTNFPLYYVTNPAIQTAFQSFWNNENGSNGVPLQQDTAQMWDALSASVANDPGVIGYDLINEPWPGTTWNPCATDAAGCPVQDAAIDAYNARMDTTIRANDTTHLVFPEPYVLFNFGEAPTNIGLAGGDANSGMSWHMYTTDAAHEPSVIANAIAWSNRTGGALLTSEWGATNDPAAISRQAGELDDALLPWIFWAYNENIQSNMHVPPTDATINTTTADALVRPHPLAVAGTPTSEHFEPTTDTLTFDYSTRRAGGGSFACGAVTSFQTPARRYPDGYHATVTGGVVTSQPGSAQLTVVANPGATHVSVTVEPGGSTAPTAVSSVCPETPATTTTTGPSTTSGSPGSPTPTPVAAPATAVDQQPTYTG